MRTCGVAVVGLGLMGAAAFHAVARRGTDVIGFDPLTVGERRGSSHGSCRIYRRFNFETPAYTALSDQALAAWRALEVESGTQILEPCPVLAAGPSGSALVRGSRAAAQAYLEYLYTPTGQELAARYFYRPRDPAVLARYRASFPAETLFGIDLFGGWPRAQAEYFADGGLFDRISAGHP